jgi:hypothetical protein
MEKTQACDECKMRAKYDKNPKSFAGRFWKWHIKFCPGWKMYMKSIDDTLTKIVLQNNVPLFLTGRCRTFSLSTPLTA